MRTVKTTAADSQKEARMKTEQATYAQMVEEARSLERSRMHLTAAGWWRSAAKKAPTHNEQCWCRAQFWMNRRAANILDR
jgi:hypothetical protein